MSEREGGGRERGREGRRVREGGREQETLLHCSACGTNGP